MQVRSVCCPAVDIELCNIKPSLTLEVLSMKASPFLNRDPEALRIQANCCFVLEMLLAVFQPERPLIALPVKLNVTYLKTRPATMQHSGGMLLDPALTSKKANCSAEANSQGFGQFCIALALLGMWAFYVLESMSDLAHFEPGRFRQELHGRCRKVLDKACGAGYSLFAQRLTVRPRAR